MKLQFLTFLFVGLVAASPTPEPNEAASLDTRADKWCKVSENTNCRTGPGTQYPIVRVISPSQTFGVNCKTPGNPGTWDWIPGWGCWVSARYTRSTTTGSCEDGVGQCN